MISAGIKDPNWTRCCLISADGTEQYLGTIRYVGPVELPASKQANPDSIWLGIEWDDPSRGRHSGDYLGKKYFDTSVANAGSFIRSNHKGLEFGQTFLQALKAKYTESMPKLQVHETIFGDTNIPVSMYGFDKISDKQSHLDQLMEVGLAGRLVAFADPEPEIHDCTPNIRDLDLSKNLLGSWVDIGNITKQLPHLESLRLGHNRFAILSSPSSIPHQAFVSVRVLSLNHTKIQWDQLEILESHLPNLEQLHLGFNELRSLSSVVETHAQCTPAFSKLTLLNLESNDIEEWIELERFKNLSNLKQLYLQNNRITSIQHNGFDHLEFLNLTKNRIERWSSVDALNEFKELKELRFRENPVLGSMSRQEIETHMVGRLERLSMLNGAQISVKDRLNCEVYYLKHCLQLKMEMNETDLHQQHPRLSSLLKKYEDFPISIEKPSNLLKDNLLELSIKCGEKEFNKKIPNQMKVRVLKNIVQKLTGIASARQQLFVIDISEQQTEFRILMDDDLKEISFYVDGSKGVLLVQE